MEELTSREVELLGLLSSGLSNKEISAKLNITLQTVKNHLFACYGKIGVHNRVGAVMWYLARLPKKEE